MKRLLPVILALIGLVAGLGAGLYLQPPPPSEETSATALVETPAGNERAAATVEPPPPADTVVLRLPNQFLVPLIGESRVRAMVVLGLALELRPDHRIDLQLHEARIRAIFLQLLFDHANLGGFDGVFTSGEQLHSLRRTLLEAARAEFGASIHDVLITDLIRQEQP